MSLLRTQIKALLGPALSKRVATMLHGKRLDEVELAFAAFSRAGIVGTMVDVGAHFGGSLHPFAEAGWDVFALEPDEANRRHLEALVGDNKKVRIDVRGVSDQSRKGVPFFASDVSTGISSLSNFHDTHRQTQTIDLTSLRDFVEEMQIEKIDFLKTDIEGHDLFALRGVPWERVHPDCIVSEYEDRKTKKNGYDTADMYEFLTSRGYEVVISEWFPIEEYGRHHRWKAFRRSPNEIDPASWGNVIAVDPRSAVASALSWNALKAI
jgi:FkbM family methyltransferase